MSKANESCLYPAICSVGMNLRDWEFYLGEQPSCINVNREIPPGYWWTQTDQNSIENDNVIVILCVKISEKTSY